MLYCISMLSQNDLSRIYWVTGSACAGKSTISTYLAEHLDWNIYHCDDWFENHRERANPSKHPIFYKISHVTGDDLWLRPLEEQIATQGPFSDDEFDLITEDLLHELQKDERPLIYDGYVSPHLLKPLLPSTQHAFYLIPTEQFQLHHYRQRTWIHDVLAKTSNKEAAWDNWMKRDLASARLLERELLKYEMPWLSVDGKLTVQETTKIIMDHFRQIMDTPSWQATS